MGIVFRKLTIGKVLLLLCLWISVSCGNWRNKALEEALSLAGTNRGELEKVLEHYKDSTLKLEAAEFLIANMPGLAVPEPEVLVTFQVFYQTCDSLRKIYKGEQRGRYVAMVDSLWMLSRERLMMNGIKRVPLLKAVTAKDLIAEIDLAFSAWQSNAFSKDCSFQVFCEYILPFYRGENVVPDDIRMRFRNKHGETYFKKRERRLTEEVDSILFLYKDLDYCNFSNWSVPVLNMDAFVQLGAGSCGDKGIFNSLLLSALGVPVAVDFVPAWGNRSYSHSWNVLVLDGKHYAFDPFWAQENWVYNDFYNNTGVYDFNNQGEFRCPKVYRKTYSTHWESSLLGKGVEVKDIPPLFRNMKKIDVSVDYFETSDIEVSFSRSETEGVSYAYLCVFGTNGWVPVQYGKIEHGKAVFKEMGRNIVYLPALYRGGTLFPVAPPVWLKPDGEVQTLNGGRIMIDSLVTRDVVMRPFTNRTYLKCMSGTNFTDLETNDTLCSLSGILPSWRTYLPISGSRAIRQIRIDLPSDSIALGELEFYTAEGKVENVRITSSLQTLSDCEEEGALFDGLSATCYHGRVKKQVVDIDLGKESVLTAIAVMPYLISNITNDSQYRLFYWEDHQWHLQEEQRGTGQVLIFKNVPGNRLLRLEHVPDDAEKKISERIFLYEAGEVMWM